MLLGLAAATVVSGTCHADQVTRQTLTSTKWCYATGKTVWIISFSNSGFVKRESVPERKISYTYRGGVWTLYSPTPNVQGLSLIWGGAVNGSCIYNFVDHDSSTGHVIMKQYGDGLVRRAIIEAVPCADDHIPDVASLPPTRRWDPLTDTEIQPVKKVVP